MIMAKLSPVARGIQNYLLHGFLRQISLPGGLALFGHVILKFKKIPPYFR
jgi:hypothetical protein